MIGRRGSPSKQAEEKPKGFDDFELRLGDVMRGERATLGKSLLDVQRELKIKATYVAAIENADVSAFETPGFVAGYVRSYARYLGMDPEWAYARFCQEANFSVHHGMSPGASGKTAGKTVAPAGGSTAKPGQGKQAAAGGFGAFGLSVKGRAGAKGAPAAKPGSRDPLSNPNATFVPRTPATFTAIEPRAIGSLMVLVALIGGIGYGGWSVLQQVQRVQLAPVDQAPGAVADLDPLASVAALPDGDKTADVSVPAKDKLDRLYRPQALDVPVMVSRDGPIGSIKPGSLGALSPSAADVTTASADGTDPGAVNAAVNAAVAAVAGQGAAPAQGTAQPGQVKVVADAAPAVQIIAVRPAWVRVRSADGTILFEKVLDSGERYTVPQSEAPATLRAGNSGAVYFMVNGKAYGPAAPGASVVKNVALTPSSLEQKYQMADLARDPDLAGAVAVAQAQPQKTPDAPSQ